MLKRIILMFITILVSRPCFADYLLESQGIYKPCVTSAKQIFPSCGQIKYDSSCKKIPDYTFDACKYKNIPGKNFSPTDNFNYDFVQTCNAQYKDNCIVTCTISCLYACANNGTYLSDFGSFFSAPAEYTRGFIYSDNGNIYNENSDTQKTGYFPHDYYYNTVTCENCPTGWICKNGQKDKCADGYKGTNCETKCSLPEICSNGVVTDCQSTNDINYELKDGQCQAVYTCDDPNAADCNANNSISYCKENYFITNPGTVLNACTKCPENSYSCGPDSNMQCKATYYRPTASSALCTKCPQYSTCENGGIGLIGLTCKGDTHLESGVCECSTNGHGSCRDDGTLICDAGYIKLSTNSGYNSCTNCRAGYYCPTAGGGQNPCPSGAYCPKASINPQNCPAGYFCLGTTETNTSKCTSTQTNYCPTDGKQDEIDGTTIQQYCRNNCLVPANCPAGTYCEVNSQRPTKCPDPWNNSDPNSTKKTDCYATLTPGKYINNGTTNNTCPGGSYCPGGNIYYNETGIEECPAGHYCPDGASEPTKCDPGYYCPAGSSTQENCDTGYYCKDGKKTECPAGHYCPENSSEPTPCPAGYFCLGTTDTKCTSTQTNYCPTDGRQTTLADGTKQYCRNNCLVPANCPAGTYCPAGSSEPTPCPDRSKKHYRNKMPKNFHLNDGDQPTTTWFPASHAGAKAITDCRLSYVYTNDRGMFSQDSVPYSTATGKYDNGFENKPEGEPAIYYNVIFPGYYGKTQVYNGTCDTNKYQLYQDAQKCPAGQYCLGRTNSNNVNSIFDQYSNLNEMDKCENKTYEETNYIDGPMAGGYFATCGAKSATPTYTNPTYTPIGDGCVQPNDDEKGCYCGQVSQNFYSTGGGTAFSPTGPGNGCLADFKCGVCPAGNYCPAGTSTPPENQNKCDKGYYCPNTTEASGRGRKECPGGTTSETGASAKEQCYIMGGDKGTKFCVEGTCFYIPNHFGHDAQQSN